MRPVILAVVFLAAVAVAVTVDRQPTRVQARVVESAEPELEQQASEGVAQVPVVESGSVQFEVSRDALDRLHNILNVPYHPAERFVQTRTSAGAAAEAEAEAEAGAEAEAEAGVGDDTIVPTWRLPKNPYVTYPFGPNAPRPDDYRWVYPYYSYWPEYLHSSYPRSYNPYYYYRGMYYPSYDRRFYDLYTPYSLSPRPEFAPWAGPATDTIAVGQNPPTDFPQFRAAVRARVLSEEEMQEAMQHESEALRRAQMAYEAEMSAEEERQEATERQEEAAEMTMRLLSQGQEQEQQQTQTQQTETETDVQAEAQAEQQLAQWQKQVQAHLQAAQQQEQTAQEQGQQQQQGDQNGNPAALAAATFDIKATAVTVDDGSGVPKTVTTGTVTSSVAGLGADADTGAVSATHSTSTSALAGAAAGADPRPVHPDAHGPQDTSAPHKHKRGSRRRQHSGTARSASHHAGRHYSNSFGQGVSASDLKPFPYLDKQAAAAAAAKAGVSGPNSVLDDNGQPNPWVLWYAQQTEAAQAHLAGADSVTDQADVVSDIVPQGKLGKDGVYRHRVEADSKEGGKRVHAIAVDSLSSRQQASIHHPHDKEPKGFAPAWDSADFDSWNPDLGKDKPSERDKHAASAAALQALFGPAPDELNSVLGQRAYFRKYRPAHLVKTKKHTYWIPEFHDKSEAELCCEEEKEQHKKEKEAKAQADKWKGFVHPEWHRDKSKNKNKGKSDDGQDVDYQGDAEYQGFADDGFPVDFDGVGVGPIPSHSHARHHRRRHRGFQPAFDDGPQYADVQYKPSHAHDDEPTKPKYQDPEIRGYKGYKHGTDELGFPVNAPDLPAVPDLPGLPDLPPLPPLPNFDSPRASGNTFTSKHPRDDTPDPKVFHSKDVPQPAKKKKEDSEAKIVWVKHGQGAQQPPKLNN